MEIIITGHKGFIGRNITKRLKAMGHTVIGLSYPDQDLRYCDIPIADGMIHLAANMGGVGFFTSEQFNPILDNMMMDARVIRHCQKNNIRLFYPSSACAYPVTTMNMGIELDESLLDEPFEPDQMYGFEKLFITKLAEYADFDFRVGVLHTIYGKGQEYKGKRAKFIPQICYKFATQNDIEVWGDGKQTRTFLNIYDAVEMILEVFFSEDYFGAVNISSSREIKIDEVISILTKLSGKTNIIYNKNKPTGPTKRAVDMSKFNLHYKTRPIISLEKGLKEVFNYVKNNCDTSSLLS
jgi:GDP-D-mannose 3', 5'-epimerase